MCDADAALLHSESVGESDENVEANMVNQGVKKHRHEFLLQHHIRNFVTKGALKEFVDEGLDVAVDDYISSQVIKCTENGQAIEDSHCTLYETLEDSLGSTFTLEKCCIDVVSAAFSINAETYPEIREVEYYKYKVGWQPKKIDNILGLQPAYDEFKILSLCLEHELCPSADASIDEMLHTLEKEKNIKR